MESPNFTITEHTSPSSYIRQYPHAVKRDDAMLQIAIKEYKPKRHSLTDESVTIIASHGNGFPKECFEPLFDDLLTAAKDFAIHSIWSADQCNQGASYALNASALGDDPSWIDHSLDLFLMINKFRHKMKAPIIGIGHSMGCAKLVYLASIHPKLFHSLILIDPVLQDFHPPGPNAALFSSMRREHWTSRAKAESQISSNAFFSSMDPRALKLFLEFALKDTPNGGVTLSTPKAQEAWTYVRSNLLPLSENTLEGRHRERVLNPELVPFSEESRLKSMRPELLAICSAMPHLRPRTLYVYGEYSHINHDEVRTYHVENTGTGRGGNGGVAEGGVKDVDIVDCGHLCVLEKPGVIAEHVSNWLGDEVARWKEEISIWEKVDTGRSKNSQTELSDAWMAAVKEDTMAERPKAAEKAKL